MSENILLVRKVGGLGDIFMHRMLFEDIKIIKPDCHLTFACPSKYHEAVIDHPFLDKVIEPPVTLRCKLPFDEVYDTSFVCARYELANAPYSDKHRSDIWAEHCGLTLTKHDMHFVLSTTERKWATDRLAEANGRKIIVIAPVSAMTGKNLDMDLVLRIAEQMGEHFVFVLHDKPLLTSVRQITGCTIRQMMSLINHSDYVISVDTAALHCAGGMGKPLVGIFSFVDGLVYLKYFQNAHLVQKHRSLDSNWTCGPCYDYTKCSKIPDVRVSRKPCITEITFEDIMVEVNKMAK